MARYDWCYLATASDRLELTPQKLSRLRRSGALKRGHHYRDLSAPGAGRATYQYHVGRIKALFQQPSEKRRRYG